MGRANTRPSLIQEVNKVQFEKLLFSRGVASVALQVTPLVRNNATQAVPSGSPIRPRMRKIGSRELLCPFPAGPACGCGASATRKEDAYSCGFSLLPAKLLQASSVGSRAGAILVSRVL